MKNLVRLRRVDEIPNFPFKSSTLYKWRLTGKHLKVFVKVGGAVFVDLDQLDRVIEAGRGR